MPVLVTSNFDDDSGKNEQYRSYSMETPYSHYKTLEHFWTLNGSYSLARHRSDLAEIQNHTRFYGYPHYLQETNEIKNS